jgi:hypothetical protein
MSLHPDTVRRIHEFFGQHRCCKCDSVAARFCGGQFYCAAHFRPPRGKGQRGPQVHRHARTRSPFLS